jgi:hypothetical protein
LSGRIKKAKGEKGARMSEQQLGTCNGPHWGSTSPHYYYAGCIDFKPSGLDEKAVLRACLSLALEALAAYGDKKSWDNSGVMWVGGAWPTFGGSLAQSTLARIKELQGEAESSTGSAGTQ